jgi:hypothetical protein
VFRGQVKQKNYVKLKEDDILRLSKLILPMLNFAISKTKELFSGEPSMTLKVIIPETFFFAKTNLFVVLVNSFSWLFQVAPLLLLGAEYGHFITIWRLSAIGETI